VGPAGSVYIADAGNQRIRLLTPVGLPSINPAGTVNAASSAAGSPVAPGSIATVYGRFLINSLSTASSAPLPINLAGLSLQFGSGLSAPLFAVSGGQVNFQVPWELAGQSQISLSATVNGETSGTQTIALAPFAPGIFTMNAQGTGQGAILDTSYRLVDSSNPAIAGSTILQIYCTGLGAVTYQPPSGSPPISSQLSQTTTTPTVTIGGVLTQVLFSGLAPGSVGEYQVNALVPTGASKGAAVPVVIAIGGATSNTVAIAVQ
jgi:minor extracellular serine protease Vpr